MKAVSIASPDELPGVAQRVLHEAGPHKVWALYGKMGAGKTTLIRALCEALGVIDRSSSPSYTIVNEYLATNGAPVFHFDFYRIEAVEEAFDLGFEEYLDSGHYCFIEWPERIEELLPDDVLKLHIEVEDEKRLVWWELPGQR